MIKKVLLPLDGSKIAEERIPEAINMLKVPGTDLHLTLLQVIELLPLLPQDKETESRILKERALKYLNEVKKKIEGKEIKVELVVNTGKPAVEICEYAAHNDVEIVIMSSHGHGRVVGWALGSVADDVVRYCSTPVLVLKVS